MSAVKQVPREKIVEAALEEVREGGMRALNVRALAKRLGCSTRPIYLSFGRLDEVKEAVAGRIYQIYRAYLEREAAGGKYPPFKAYGMAYIRFAREEKQFFSYMFMRDRSGGSSDEENIDYILSAVESATGLSREQAKLFHLEIWMFVHGVAAMIANSYADPDEELISDMLTDVFMGLKARFLDKNRAEN